MTTRRDWRRAALHEAGHVIMCRLVGARVRGVSLRLCNKGGVGGTVRMYWTAGSNTKTANVLVSLAGLAGEHVWLKHKPNAGRFLLEPDCRRVAKLLEIGNLRMREFRKALDPYYDEAWGALFALRDELFAITKILLDHPHRIRGGRLRAILNNPRMLHLSEDLNRKYG
jgi:hypothetical protein